MMKKRLLLIGMNFYDYEDKIRNAIAEMGFLVDKIQDYPKRPRGYNRFIPEKIKIIDRKNYHERILKKLYRVKYDIVLVLVGRFLSTYFLENLRKNNPDAKFILYLWDNVKRVENFEAVKSFYDEIISFEPCDCIKYGFRFLPLFYIPEVRAEKKDIRYDICTVSSNHSGRLDVMKKLTESNPDKIKYRLYVAVGYLYYVKYYLSGNYASYLKKGLICITGYKDPSETYKLMNQSKAVLDIPYESQKGLTIRTIEALGCGIKLITTNEQVKYYDFYNENNICVIDKRSPEVNPDFLKSEYRNVPDGIYRKYSLRNWVKNVLSESGAQFLNCDINSLNK